ncbi:MAG: GAF domain-containing protein [Anaerolineae bacterium]
MSLFAEMAHSPHALLLLLSEDGAPLTCIENNDVASSGHCESWQALSPEDIAEFSRPATNPHDLPDLDDQGWVITVPMEEEQPVALLVFEDLKDLPAALPWAESLAIATPIIQNARLERQKEIAEGNTLLADSERLRRSRIISGTLQFMGNLGDLDATLQALLETLQEVLDIDNLGLIYQRDSERENDYHRLGHEVCTEFLIRFYRRQDNPAFGVHDTRLQMVDAWDGPYELAEIARRGEFHTVITLPLHVPGLTVGALLISRNEVRPFNEEEIVQATLLANQAALALHNADLFQQEREQREMAEALAQAAGALTRSLDLEEILDQILEQLERVVPHTASNVLLIESEEEVRPVRWRGYANFGLEEHFSSVRLSPNLPNIQHMIKRRRPVIIRDTANSSQWKRSEEFAGIRSYAGAPIVVNNEVIGFVSVDGDQVDYFDERDAQRLAAFADYAALALQNARFFQQSQQRQFYLEGLNSVIAAINSVTDLDTILRTGLSSALEISEMDRGGIYIWDRHKDLLQLRVHQGLSDEGITPIKTCVPGEGIVGRAFKRQQTIVKRENKGNKTDLPDVLVNASNLQISIPLTAEGQSIGVLSMSRRHGGELSQDATNLLRAIADQLALAVQRGQLARTLREQINSLHHLYEMSAALLGQLGTSGVIFVLLRTLQDVVPEALITTFYAWQDETWRRTKAYLRNDRHLDRAAWQQEDLSASEYQILERCRSTQARVDIEETDNALLQNLGESLHTDIGQALYYPLFMPTSEFFGVIGLALKDGGPLSPQKAALVQAIIQQGTAALARMSLYETTREEESRLRAILESSQDGIFLVGEDQKIRYVNEQALHMLHISGTPGGWEGQTFPNAILAIRKEARDLAHILLEKMQQAGSPPFTTSVEPNLNFETRRGRTLTLHHWPVYAQQHQLLGDLFLFRDVTEQIAVERMRDDLLHMLVHDLRNPIAVIINALQIAQDPHMHDIVQEASTLALGNAEQILTLINAILDIGRLESDRFEIDPRPTRLQPLLHPLRQHIALSAKKVTLETQLPEDLPYVLIDPIIVERVFRNLIDNALKFVPETQGIIRISSQSHGDHITVEVYNNGPSIPPEMKIKLFEKFAKGRYRGQGYGLGLAFCRLAIEAHNGKIWTENRPGGVSFYFTLPTTDWMLSLT